MDPGELDAQAERDPHLERSISFHSTFSAHQFEQTLAAVVLKLLVARIEEVTNSRHHCDDVYMY
jgi:hypothetical protein